MSNRAEVAPWIDLDRAEIRIRLFGPAKVEWVGQPLSIPRRQARALLFYLACRLQPVPRERLGYLFWPDTPEQTARRSLTRLLTHVRLALPDPDVLVTAPDGVSLDPARTWSDTVAFEGLYTAPAGKQRLVALAQAVELYRGPFLAGFTLADSPEFEAWVELERQIHERRYLEALSSLVDGKMAAGEYEAALGYAQLYLMVDELMEEMHRRLIELYAMTGDRGAALLQFERCAAILERELGVSPLPETWAVYRAVREGRTPGIASRARKLEKPAMERRLPLVGRDEAIGQIQQAYEQVRAGQGQVVLLSGEMGIGKSRLLQEFARSQQDQALTVISAGYQRGQTIPFQLITQALRLALPHARSLTDLPLAWRMEAARLLPELQDLYPDLPVSVALEPLYGRMRLFEALTQIFLTLASTSHSLILGLDDLHWADRATRDWLVYFSQRIQKSPVLVIGTCQSEESGRLIDLRQDIMRLGILKEIQLSGLQAPDLVQLLQYLRNPWPDMERLAARLYEHTGGNPFFLIETLQALTEAGQVPEDGNDLLELPFPDSVRVAVESRLNRLSPVARQILEAAAVLGSSFTFDLVHATAGRSENDLIDGLDELITRQVLLEEATRYRFVHDLIRMMVYQRLSYGRRRLLHRRAGEALQQLGQGEAATFAWHFERAEQLDRAARYHLQAGLAANQVSAYHVAQVHFEQALAFLEQEKHRLRDPVALAENRRLRIQAMNGRGWAFRLNGEMDRYIQDSQEVARLARLVGDLATAADVCRREAFVHRWFCRFAEAQAVAEEGIQASRQAGSHLLQAQCLMELGLAVLAIGDYDRARTALEPALEIFTALEQFPLEIQVTAYLARLYRYQGQYTQAIELSQQALARCETMGLSVDRRFPLAALGAATAATGQVGLAEPSLLESLELARQLGDRVQEILCLGELGRLYVQLLKPAEALEVLQRALVTAIHLGACGEQSWLLAGLAEAHRLAGRPDQASAYARDALALAEEHGQGHIRRQAQVLLESLAHSDGS